MLILSSLIPVVGVQRSKYHNAHVAQSWFLEEETPDLVAIALHQTFAYTRTRSIITNILVWVPSNILASSLRFQMTHLEIPVQPGN
jgi:hypothetical protein